MKKYIYDCLTFEVFLIIKTNIFFDMCNRILAIRLEALLSSEIK